MKTFEYELRVMQKDIEGNPIEDKGLLPEDGSPFPRIRCGDESQVREEVLRKHHDLVCDVPCREVYVSVRPFA